MAKKGELLNVKPVVKSETEIKVEEYDYCFNLVTDEKGTRIAVARTMVSDKVFATTDEAKAYIDSKPWGLIMAAAHVCMKVFNNNEKNQ